MSPRGASILLLTLALVAVTQQRPRSYGNLRVCSRDRRCGVYAVETEAIDGKMFYVLKHYPEEAGGDGSSLPPPAGGEHAAGHFQPIRPIYIIGGPLGQCPEGQLPDHSGKCRDIEF